MGSTRLPGKVLKPIAGKALLDHPLGRLEGLGRDAQVVVATSLRAPDDLIAAHCLGRVSCFRGSELDVLDRYFRCAEEYGFDQVVRLTADNPFTDIVELGRLIDFHIHGGYDYSHAFGIMPLGVGAEIFTMEALAISQREGLAPNHREHVNEFIQENPRRFRIGVLAVPLAKRAPQLRLTVDTPEDYGRACRLAELVAPGWQTTEGAIAAC
jgi:spore coat polysaccharide biosynthesis protein SpsF